MKSIAPRRMKRKHPVGVHLPAPTQLAEVHVSSVFRVCCGTGLPLARHATHQALQVESDFRGSLGFLRADHAPRREDDAPRVLASNGHGRRCHPPCAPWLQAARHPLRLRCRPWRRYAHRGIRRCLARVCGQCNRSGGHCTSSSTCGCSQTRCPGSQSAWIGCPLPRFHIGSAPRRSPARCPLQCQHTCSVG